MEILKLVSGKIFFDDFNDSDLNSKWTIIPDDATRYSLVERPGYIKLFHGEPDLIMLTDEVDSYVLDIRNDYVPLNDKVFGGITVYNSMDTQLEVLEYMDSNKDPSSVYQFLRIERDNEIYTAYGRNTQDSIWELIGSGQFKSSNKVGIKVKGPSVEGSSEYNVDYFKMYKSHYVQVLNVPVDYTVRLLDETSNQVIYASKVNSPNSGVSLKLTEVPPIRAYFEVYDNTNILVYTSTVQEIVGGDVYYYGAVPLVTVDGKDMYLDQEHFIGYFTSGVIDFEVLITNPYLSDFEDLKLQAIQYKEDPGYKCVSFSLSKDAEYTKSITIDKLGTQETVIVYGRVLRDTSVLVKSDVDPFKFNLSLEF